MAKLIVRLVVVSHRSPTLITEAAQNITVVEAMHDSPGSVCVCVCLCVSLCACARENQLLISFFQSSKWIEVGTM